MRVTMKYFRKTACFEEKIYHEVEKVEVDEGRENKAFAPELFRLCS
jgi:hypothetical protein